NLAGVADTLLFVWIRLTEPPDVRRHLAHELPIDARDRDVGLLVDRHVDALRDVEHDGVGVPERKNHLLALEFRAVADADDVEFLLEALGDAKHGVRDERAGKAMELSEARILSRASRFQMTVGQLEVDTRRKRLPHLALRSLHVDGAVDDLDGDA